MKIVHVSNFTMKWNGENYFSIPYKLNNGLTRLGHNVFSVCDRDLADSVLFGLRAAGRDHANRKVKAICSEIRPDLILLGHCSLVTTETVASLRKIVPRVRIAHWNCDPLFFPDNMARLKALAALVDATFVTTAGRMMEAIAEIGRTAFIPNPVDKSIDTGRAFENSDADIDLLFMGSPIPERIALCDAITKAVPGLRFEIRGFGPKPAIHGAQIFHLLSRAKMGLSLSRRDDVPLYASDRMSMMMGNGLMTFADHRTGFGSVFAPDELVTFDGLDDLIAKVRAYANDGRKRQEIAERGWRRIHELFSETRVAQWMIELATGVTAGKLPPWLEIRARSP